METKTSCRTDHCPAQFMMDLFESVSIISAIHPSVCGQVIQLIINALCWPLSQFTHIGVQEIDAVQTLAPVDAALDAAE